MNTFKFQLHFEITMHLANELSLFPMLLVLAESLREQSSQAILKALRDENLNDPRERIEIAQSHAFYRPSLLGQP